MGRFAGIFLHPTSLPSEFGVGDLGESAYRWVDLLKEYRHGVWQVCPLGPTGYGDSPYQCVCSFAGNPVLISPRALVKEGLLSDADLRAFQPLPDECVVYGPVIDAKEELFRRAYSNFDDTEEFLAFCTRERYWLDDFTLYMVAKQLQHGLPWCKWEASLRLRFPGGLKEIAAANGREIRYHKFLQFIFALQWTRLREYARKRGVLIVGDVPYYVAYDSCEAWSAPDAFEFDDKGVPIRVAGVPPDYFSETGQLWGNPIYRWNRMAANGYEWWASRIRRALEFVDIVRLDHFRGFESFWAIPGDSTTAQNGEWVEGPGIGFFDALREQLGELPIIAEDLGELTEDVEQLRRAVGVPGMKVLQFAFDGNPENPYLPYNIPQDSVVYTGTHDNDTSLGWFGGLSEVDRGNVCRYLGCSEQDFLIELLRLAYGSPADLCIVPLQDILGLGTEHRMNTPGCGEGNWQWRFTWDMLDSDRMSQMRDFACVYGRYREKPVPPP